MKLAIGKKLNNYRGKKGSIHFVYEVTGDAESTAAYLEYRKANGWSEELIFNSLQPLDNNTPLQPNQDGTRYFPATDLEREYRRQNMTLNESIAEKVAPYIAKSLGVTANIDATMEEVLASIG